MEYDPVEFGELKARVASMESNITSMQADIKELLAIANRGRGALMMSLTVGSVIGGIIALVVEFFVKKA